MSAELRAATLPALARVAGLVHGFERRVPDRPAETREETRSRVAASLEPLGRLFLLHQVHGVEVVEAPWEGLPAGDAGVASQPGLILGIETADCLPLLLVDPTRRSVAAAHAGWRGTAAGIAGRAVAALVARGSRPEDLLAALGPAIGSCCYEVGPELREAFGPDSAVVLRPGPRGRLHLDLRLANQRQLLRAGLGERSIGHLADCTFCRADEYHSYRREGGGAGRMVSFVGFRRA